MRARTATAAALLAGLCLAATAAAPPATASAATVGDAAGPLEVREMTGPDLPLRDLAPGDTVDWVAEVTNTSRDGAALSIRFDAIGGGSLVADPRSGIELGVFACTDGYVPGTSPLRCRGPLRPLAAGPAATTERIDTTTPLAAGDALGITVRVRFPATAGDEMERAGGSLRIAFALVDDSAAGSGPQPAPSGSGAAPTAGIIVADHVPRDLLPVTGRDIASALAGALLALLAGGILLLGARRRRPAEEAGA